MQKTDTELNIQVKTAVYNLIGSSLDQQLELEMEVEQNITDVAPLRDKMNKN